MKRKIAQIVHKIMLMLMGAACGIAVVIELGAGDLLRAELWMIAAMLLGYYIQTIVHEGGHLVCGLLSGYHFRSFRVGTLTLVQTNGKWKFRRMKVAGTGGQCLMDPPAYEDGTFPVMLYNLGGCLANLLAGIVCFALYRSAAPHSFWRLLWLLNVILAGYCVLLNGIPMQTKMIPNDGYNALNLHRDPDSLRAFWLTLKINGLNAEGIAMRDMPDEWFAMPTDEQMKNGLLASLAVMAVSRLEDRGEYALAEQEMERILSVDSGIPGLYRAMLTNERIFMNLVVLARPDVAEALQTKEQKKMMKALRTSPGIVRTQYALALLRERDEKKARKLRKLFEKLADRYPYPVEMIPERERLALIEEKAAKQ